MADRARKKTRLYAYGASKSRTGGYSRARSDDRYHTARWTRESKAFRESHPLCEMCLEKGALVPSEVVDHVIPIAICADFWDQDNWQALCKKCNIAKGNKDKKVINR